jgi:hypothetical protein
MKMEGVPTNLLASALNGFGAKAGDVAAVRLLIVIDPLTVASLLPVVGHWSVPRVRTCWLTRRGHPVAEATVALPPVTEFFYCKAGNEHRDSSWPEVFFRAFREFRGYESKTINHERHETHESGEGSIGSAN